MVLPFFHPALSGMPNGQKRAVEKNFENIWGFI
jgi:hypothetical protein